MLQLRESSAFFFIGPSAGFPADGSSHCATFLTDALSGRTPPKKNLLSDQFFVAHSSVLQRWGAESALTHTTMRRRNNDGEYQNISSGHPFGTEPYEG